MTSAQLHPLVGQTDIVERLQQPLGVSMFAKPGDLIADMDDQRAAAAAEIERLRTALRAVRASTDPRWQAQIISDALRETK
jgi:hypothetical protein